MKKVLAISLVLLMTLSMLVACGGGKGGDGQLNGGLGGSNSSAPTGDDSNIFDNPFGNESTVVDNSTATDGDNSIIGTWVAEDDGMVMEYTFNAGGKGVATAMGVTVDLTWSTSGNRITLSMTYMGETETESGTYTLTGDKLILVNDEGRVLDLTKKSAYVGGEDTPADSKVDDSVVGGDTDSSLVDTWVLVDEDGMEMEYSFEADGTGTISAMGIELDMVWSTEGDFITIEITYMGETETEGGTYKVQGNKLYITTDGETVTLTRKGASSDTPDTPDTPDVGGDVDSSLIGSWVAEEDGVEMVFTFGADNKGSLSAMGMSMDMTWYVSGGKLYATVSFMGETEEMFEGADYVVTANTLSITVDGETVVFDKK